MKLWLIVLFIRVPVIGLLLLVHKTSEFFWIKSDKLLDFANENIPGFIRDREGNRVPPVEVDDDEW